MQITITMDLTPENLTKINTLFNSLMPETKPEKIKEKIEKVNEEAKKPAEEVKKTAEEVKKPSVSREDLMAVALKLSRAGKSDTLAEIFSEFGAAKLSEIKADDYPAVMERLVSVNA